MAILRKAKTMMNLIRCAAFTLMLSPTASVAQDFYAGLDAYVTGDYATALGEWRPLAEQGQTDAQVNVGLMYLRGQGVPQDYVEAARWYRLAAEQGNATAQVNLGLMYHRGEGVPQDYIEAARWNRLAAEQGQTDAQFNLGRMYRLGEGVPQDFLRTYIWFNIAAANGHEHALEARDDVASRLTPADLSEAQRLARLCFDSDYRDCD